MNNHIKPLTSLRFFFCIMVFVSHLSFLNNSNNIYLKIINEFVFQEGYIGVNFFFILSGFVLSLNYYDKIVGNSISDSSFYLGRFSRIYPLHFLTYLVSIPLLIKVIISSPLKYLGLSLIHLSLLQSFFPLSDYYFNFNAPSWSISDETFFYFLTPFFFRFFVKLKIPKSVFITFFVLLSTLFLGMYFSSAQYHHPLFYINPIFRVFDFIIGILIFFIYQKGSIKFNSIKSQNYLEVLSIIIFIIFFCFHKQIPQVYRFSIYYWLPITLILIIFSKSGGYVSTILSNKIIVYLGEISFGFYMIHQLVIRYYSIIFINKLGFKENYLFNTVFIFSVTLILSIISFEFYEKKMNSFIKSKFLNKKN